MKRGKPPASAIIIKFHDKPKRRQTKSFIAEWKWKSYVEKFLLFGTKNAKSHHDDWNLAWLLFFFKVEEFLKFLLRKLKKKLQKIEDSNGKFFLNQKFFKKIQQKFKNSRFLHKFHQNSSSKSKNFIKNSSFFLPALKDFQLPLIKNLQKSFSAHLVP